MFNSFVRSLLVGMVVGLIVISVASKLADRYRIKPLPKVPPTLIVSKLKEHNTITIPPFSDIDISALAGYIVEKEKWAKKTMVERPEFTDDLNEILALANKLENTSPRSRAFHEGINQLHSDVAHVQDEIERIII